MEEKDTFKEDMQKIFRDQLELAAEKSKKEDLTVEEFVALSSAMVGLFKAVMWLP